MLPSVSTLEVVTTKAKCLSVCCPLCPHSHAPQLHVNVSLTCVPDCSVVHAPVNWQCELSFKYYNGKKRIRTEIWFHWKTIEACQVPNAMETEHPEEFPEFLRIHLLAILGSCQNQRMSLDSRDAGRRCFKTPCPSQDLFPEQPKNAGNSAVDT